MRLVYIILAHQLPDLTVRLVRRLATPQSTFLVHWDRRSPDHGLEFILKELVPDCDVRALQRHACHWGTFPIVAATLEGVKVACAEANSFDRLILLSGQDYPIKTSDMMADFFRRYADRSFIQHVPFPKPDWHRGGWDRVRLRWELPAGADGAVMEPVPVEPMASRPFPEGLRPYGGTQFWALTEEAARYVHEFTDRYPDIARFFEEVFVPDEIYFQTVLACSPVAETLENDALHFVKWNRPGKVLVSADIDALEKTPHLFARKFDRRIDAQLLDLVDDRLLHSAKAPVQHPRR
jgi:Core-2/I-Branching enzyme